MKEKVQPKQVRLGELIAALSLACDLGNDFPLEKALRNCVLALGLARSLGLSDDECSDLYYVALLRFIGCTAYAHEISSAFGDDNNMRNTFAPVDFGRPTDAVRAAVKDLRKGAGGVARVKAVGTFLTKGQQIGNGMIAADCEVMVGAARRLQMKPRVAVALNQMFERWDGKGGPAGLARDRIDVLARVHHIADEVEMHFRLRGEKAARAFIARGRGAWFDPEVSDVFAENCSDLIERIRPESVWDQVLELEPDPQVRIDDESIDDVASAFADLADLKSVYTLGHSTGVARLAEGAANVLSLSQTDRTTLRRAGLLHDLGRMSVPNSIWDKPGPLSTAEWERVRLHAYYSERVLSKSSLLAPIGLVAGAHHERLDGGGYHRGAPAALLTMPARVLAAADVYQALIERRSYRPAFDPAAAVTQLQNEVSRGGLDGDAARAVCEAGGQQVPRSRRKWPAELTEREVDVLRLLARGLSEKDIGQTLFIAPGTVHTHVTHVYKKIEVSTRAAAAIFAMQHDLLQ